MDEVDAIALQAVPRARACTPFVLQQLPRIVDARAAAAARDWPSTGETGSLCMGLGHISLQLVLQETDANRGRAQRRTALREHSLRKMSELLDRPDREQVFTELEASLALAPEVRRERMRTWLAAWRSGDPEPLLKHYFAERPRDEQSLERSADGAVALLTAGLQARLHADFNTIAARGTGPGKRDVWASLATLVPSLEKLLRLRQLQLYRHLLDADGNRMEDAYLALRLAQFIETDLPPFVRAQAGVAAQIATLRKRAPADQARLLARAGAATRECLATQAAAYETVLAARGLNRSVSVQQLWSKPQEVAFDSELPNGRDVKLSRVGSLRDGDYVEVEGYVARLDVVRERSDKLLTRVLLEDSSGTSKATVVTVFTHLPHRGVTHGAFCRLSGSYRTNSPVNDGQPAIEVQRLPLAELAKKAWRLRLLEAGARWVEPWPNGHNMIWSLGRHEPDGQDDLSHLGAGEFIVRKPLPQ